MGTQTRTGATQQPMGQSMGQMQPGVTPAPGAQMQQPMAGKGTFWPQLSAMLQRRQQMMQQPQQQQGSGLFAGLNNDARFRVGQAMMNIMNRR